MTVRYLADDDARLLAYRFSNDISPVDIVGAVTQAARDAKRNIQYRSLLVFDHSTDLSRIGPAELNTVKSAMKSAYGKSGIRPLQGAIVVDHSLDARIITPLWKAICEADSEVQIHYRFFIDVGPALAWLDIVEFPALASLLATP